VKKCDLVDNVKNDRWYVVCVVHGHRPPNWIFEWIYLDQSTQFWSLLSTYPLNFVRIFWGRYTLSRRQYIACMVNCRHLSNWILEGNVFRQFHTLRELITYIPTEIRENILIGGRDMPQKRNLKRAIWRRTADSGFNFHKRHLSETFLHMILQNFKEIAQHAAELYAIPLFLYLPLNLHCQRHNDTVPSWRPPIRVLFLTFYHLYVYQWICTATFDRIFLSFWRHQLL